jgi:Zn-dependent M16 (insulinase) family peptidase
MSEPAESLAHQAPHPAFQRVRGERIDSLNIGVTEFRHRKTGARHFHFQADDDNNAFLVAFLTVPQDSTGVAHILEHTSLCGSERFPVRDPFFMMIRRSLNTFMNAFTSSDWTAYPFATQNRKDFYNLLQVYLDAVFFPRLDPLDFAQEGHRVEFEQPDDPDSPLTFKGVVFNEMKGAMSSPVSQLWQTLQSELFPTVTYHYNSGGEPAAIPDLTHEALKAFHGRHYHASNAVFMTYGNLPPDEHQRVFETQALERFEPLDLHLTVPPERRFTDPRTVRDSYAADGDDADGDKTHVVLSWLLSDGTDPRALLRAHLISGVLLDNSASPLRHALETTDLGNAPSELCGLDDSTREMSFSCGLEGADPDRADAIEQLVLNVLRDVAEHGLPKDRVAAVLHQLELHQREIQSGAFPYGLRLMVNTLGPTLHGGDPVRILDIDPILDELRQAVDDPAFVGRCVREMLLDNPHRVRLDMVPDAGLNARRLESERARLAAMKAAMAEPRTAEVIALATALKRRQEQEDDPELLPKVGLEDVPPDLRIAEGDDFETNGRPAAWFDAGTNGMVYQQLVLDLAGHDEQLIDLLPLLCDAWSEVGSAGRSYLDTQAEQAATTGGIGARCSVRGSVGDLQSHGALLVLSGKALNRNHADLTRLLRETWSTARFDELSKLRELVGEQRAQRESSVTNHGHVLAMSAASAGMNGVGWLAHRWDGLLGLRRLKTLDDALEDPDELQRYGGSLLAAHAMLTRDDPMTLLVGEATERPDIVEAVAQAWPAGRKGDRPGGNLMDFEPGDVVRVAWATSTQVNFCARAYPTVPQGHPDAPALTVLGGLLRNGFLHRTVREQGGAYGGGAGYDPDTGAFRLFSYRDPRLLETLADFDRSLDWLLSANWPERLLEEAILGVIANIDRPASPAGEAVSAYFSARHGRTPEWRRAFRQQVLAVTARDLVRVADTHLVPERASTAVVSSQAVLEATPGLDLAIERL